MQSVLFKDARRSVERSMSRFISIIAIVALGISFFAGFSAIAPDMLDSVRQYYSDANIMDIQVMSSVGLTDKDVRDIGSISGCTVVPEKFVDGLLMINGESAADIDGSRLSVRALSLNINDAYGYSLGESNPGYLNRVTLLKGSWPTSPTQCLVDGSTLSTPDGFEIGATISIEGDGASLDGRLANTQFTIVGVIRTPLYISYDRGNTTVGNGKLSSFIYIPEDNFTFSYYPMLWCKVEGSDGYDPYSNEYKQFIAPYIDAVQSITDANVESRAAQLKAQYTADVEQGERDYNTAYADAQAQLQDAAAQLAQLKDLAVNGDQMIIDLQTKYNELAEKANAQIGSSRLELSAEYSAWEEKRDQYNKAKALVEQYSGAQEQYNTALNTYNTANLQVNGTLTTVTYLEKLVATTRSAVDSLNENQDATVSDIINRFTESGVIGEEVDSIISSIKGLTAMGTAEEISAYLEPELQTLETQLASSKETLENSKRELEKTKAKLNETQELVAKLKQLEASLSSAETQLNEAEKKLTAANNDIQFGELETLTKLQDMKYEINNAETNVRLAKEKVKTADADYEAAVAAINAQLEDAGEQLEYAKRQLAALDTAVSYVLDRDGALLGYEEYGQTVERTKALALIFPWFFFLVAALVCLNTMTRMVDEERTQQGALKAIGYTDIEIASKYIVYALFASLVGSVIGVCAGFCVFPLAVDKAYGILYDLPGVTLSFRWSYALIGTFITVGSTVAAAFIASYNSLRTVPATLMRPKAPKGGKHVFLEKIGFIWKRLNFTSKVTARNVIRSKKRFVMAVAGVMGCTALMLAGFGLSDSIKATLTNQFNGSDSICRYDVQISLKNALSAAADTETLATVTQRPEITSAMLNGIRVYDAASDNVGKSMEFYLVVPENSAALSSFIRLQNRRTGDVYTLDDSGAIITEKLASELKLNVGSEIIIKRNGLDDIRVRVSAVTENYTFHYVYMSRTVYAAVFGEETTYNYITATLSDAVTAAQKQVLATELMQQSGINAVSYTEEIQNVFKNIVNSLNYVVMILIVSAGLLALIVLYNLSSININERVREIATIKVLGFYDNEVSAYIFRENLILSVIGTALGLILGIFLHRAVASVGEVDVVMFGRSIGGLSYLYSALLSMGFSLLVNVILFGRLKKVNMVESLKSVE